jgi:predicted ATPase/class 3 adenylate cyclase
MEPAPALPVSAHSLPDAGTLTFLFTDVEGSTPLWERHETLMRTVAARHDALLDAVIVAHGGLRVRERGEGDSLFAIFTEPTAAVAAALAMTQAVRAEPWPPETPIRVRMGLHTGLAQYRQGDYYGPAVNRCARIRGLGHGGQILLSATTAALVREALPAGAYLRARGRHSLKGLTEPEEVCQLCHPDLPGEFPPLLSPQAPKHNLPPQLTSLIGREREQGAVLALLAAERLVTLTGAGGVGKTRLAVAVASEMVDQEPDGVWLVALAPLADPALVVEAVAQALGLREEPNRPLLATLQDQLKDRQLLLVLDNCEHLIDACAGLANALLRHCSRLRILATSREGLQVSGEQRYRVPSLSVPDSKHLPPPELVGSYEAVRLFVARARARRQEFVLTAANAHVVAGVCARLDGIPLAIELAAARVGVLPVEGIAVRLNDRFRLLTGGVRDALPRQRTLRATLDWSYDLLSTTEQVVLRRLSVFAGGWTLGAAEIVCAGDPIEGERPGGSNDLPRCANAQSSDPPGRSYVAKWEILDLLDGLVNKSLAQLEEGEDEARYDLLETVRQYAGEHLQASGEAAATRDRHLTWCVGLAEEAEPGLTGPAQVQWLARLEAEHENLRAALGWARGQEEHVLALRLAAALWRFWTTRGYLSEGRGWLEDALTRARAAIIPAAVRARALNGAGNLAHRQGDYGRATALHEEALVLRRALEDAPGIAASLGNLAIVAVEQGDYGRATALHEEALALRRALGDSRGIALALGNLGTVAMQQGDYGRATAMYQEALVLRRALGDTSGIAVVLGNLGNVASQQGDYARATALHEESLALRRALGDTPGIAVTLASMGWVAYQQGDYERATALHEEALALRRALGDSRGIANSIAHLGNIAYRRGDSRRAAEFHAESLRLSQTIGARDLIADALESLAWVANMREDLCRAASLGAAAEALREGIGMPLAPGLRAEHASAVQAMRAALGEEVFAATWAAGCALPLTEAVALALESCTGVSHGE